MGEPLRIRRPDTQTRSEVIQQRLAAGRAVVLHSQLRDAARSRSGFDILPGALIHTDGADPQSGLLRICSGQVEMISPWADRKCKAGCADRRGHVTLVRVHVEGEHPLQSGRVGIQEQHPVAVRVPGKQYIGSDLHLGATMRGQEHSRSARCPFGRQLDGIACGAIGLGGPNVLRRRPGPQLVCQQSALGILLAVRDGEHDGALARRPMRSRHDRIRRRLEDPAMLVTLGAGDEYGAIVMVGNRAIVGGEQDASVFLPPGGCR